MVLANYRLRKRVAITPSSGFIENIFTVHCMGYLRNQLNKKIVHPSRAHTQHSKTSTSTEKSFIIRLLTGILRIRSNLRLHGFCGQFLKVIILSCGAILGFVVALVFAVAETEGVVLADGRVAGCGERLPFA